MLARSIRFYTIVLCFLCSANVIFAQQFAPLISENKVWGHVRTTCQPNGQYTYSSYDIIIHGDTMIEGNAYKKMMYMEEGGEEIYFGGFRTEDQKVYYRPVWPSKEGLIYDFAAEKGDTLMLTNHEFSSDPFQLIVLESDTVDLGNGKRKRLLLQDFGGGLDETWIEGIGSLYGLHLSGSSYYFLTCGNTDLLCFHEEGTQYFQNDKFGSCDVNQSSTNIVLLEEEAMMRFYPNPAKNVLNVAFSEKADYLKIYDVAGHLLITKENPSREDFIDLSFLPGGFYILVASYRSGLLIVNDKFIVD